jgi:hypothetical protein
MRRPKVTHFDRNRRRVLLSTVAWVGGFAVLAGARPAKAWQEQKLSLKSPLGLAYADHCNAAPDHAALAAALQARLADDPSLTSLSATCPLCGCPVIVNR